MSSRKDQIPGGLADRRSAKSFPEKKLVTGKKVEREHTSNEQIAEEIAMDHLTEDPKYYTKLKKIEKMAYAQGQRDAFAKFGGASAAAPDGASSYASSGSPVATTHHNDSAQNVSQNFRYNASLSDPSNFTQPARTNSTMRGGNKPPGFTTDTTGGLE